MESSKTTRRVFWCLLFSRRAFLPQRVVFANFDGDGFGVVLRGNALEIINTQRGLPP
jgi:hypothetical protein